MGCFNEFCDITNAPITVGTPCVVIISVPDEYHLCLRANLENEKHKDLKVHRPIDKQDRGIVRGTMVYQPNIEFILFGKYDDYGGIKNIEENPYFEKFCQENNISFDDLLNCAARKDTFCLENYGAHLSDSLKQYMVNCNAHFILRSVFDEIVSEYADYNPIKYYLDSATLNIQKTQDCIEKKTFLENPNLHNYLQGSKKATKGHTQYYWRPLLNSVSSIFKTDFSCNYQTIFAPSSNIWFEDCAWQQIINLALTNEKFCEYIEKCLIFWRYLNNANIVLKIHRNNTQEINTIENKIFKKLIKIAYKKQ